MDNFILLVRRGKTNQILLVTVCYTLWFAQKSDNDKYSIQLKKNFAFFLHEYKINVGIPHLVQDKSGFAMRVQNVFINAS